MRWTLAVLLCCAMGMAADDVEEKHHLHLPGFDAAEFLVYDCCFKVPGEMGHFY